MFISSSKILRPINKCIHRQIREKSKHNFDSISRKQLKPYYHSDDIDKIFNMRKIFQTMNREERLKIFKEVKIDRVNFNTILNSEKYSKNAHAIYTLMALETYGFNIWRKSCLKISSETYSFFQYRQTFFGIPKYQIFEKLVDSSDTNRLSKSINNEKLPIGQRISNLIDIFL